MNRTPTTKKTCTKMIFEVAPSLYMVEVRKSGGDTLEFHKVMDLMVLWHLNKGFLLAIIFLSPGEIVQSTQLWTLSPLLDPLILNPIVGCLDSLWIRHCKYICTYFLLRIIGYFWFTSLKFV
ncbi:uncharacterized protein LOC122277332 isoform X1 [Carya illinoinensis]|uniref:uncharacterized protein LOC122277332 isoform X1 n=1 Tax=Carya illinoinensis TaxID=32201 RepID=UPI001C7205CE|nr:uncharacterized protein LOC122277332 isoform X1 [Carya illinoinensis]